MNFPKKLLLGSMLLLSATSVLAETADLRVIGTIAPGACTPAFAGGAVVDYGVIPLASLNQTTTTVLEGRSINYTITCNAPIPISTSWTDARAGTVTGPNVQRFGLGSHGGANIGRYRLSHYLDGTTGDSHPLSFIQQQTPGGAWSVASDTEIYNDGSRVYSYSPTGTLVPGAYSIYAGTLYVQAIIEPARNLDLTTEVTLDGLSTMTVNYL